MINDHHVFAVKLLMRIPRFENMIEIIALHDKPFSTFPRYADPERQHNSHLSSRILQVANGLDRLLMAGMPPAAALDLMIIDEDIYTSKGVLPVTKGQPETLPLLEALLNFSRRVGIKEPFSVLAPLVSTGA